MGGKTKTYTALTSGRIFDEDDCLFSIEMLRNYALTKTISMNGILKPMILNITSYFNVKWLETMGVSAESPSLVYRYNINSIYGYISNAIGTQYVVPYYADVVDLNGNSTTLTLDRVMEWLEMKYSVETSFSEEIVESWRFEADENPVCPGEISPKDLHIRLHGTDIVNIEKRVTTHLYYDAGLGEDAKYWKIAFPLELNYNEDTENNEVKMLEYEQTDSGSWISTGAIGWLEVPEDNRIFYCVKYAYNTSHCDPNGSWQEGVITIEKSKLIAEADTGHVLMIPLKKNFKFVEDDTYVNVVMSQYGFDIDDFKESLSAEEIKHAFMTYSNKLENEEIPEVKEAMENLYGPPTARTNIEITGDYYSVKYIASKSSLPGDEDQEELIPGYKYQIVIDGYEFDLDTEESGDGLWLIPLETMTHVPLKKKYNFINRNMTIWGNMEKTVHLKWYQTGFFKFISMLIGLVFAFFTGGMTAVALTLGGYMLSMALGKLLGPLGQILGSIIMMGFSPTGTWSFTNMITKMMDNFFKLLLNFGKAIMNMAFQGKYSALTSELEVLTDETEEMTETLNELIKPSIFMPLDSLGNQYDIMYKLPFAAYDESAYNPFIELNKPYMNPYGGQQ